ncbi:YbhB/YbcL family Raf kinase inhibitor-like protein [Nannocystaceae bacterium ST9]
MRCDFTCKPLLLALPLLIGTACSSTSEDDEASEGSESGTESGSESSTDTGSESGTETTDATETTTDTSTETTETTTDTTTDTTETTGVGEFTLTSPAYMEGGAIPTGNSCYGANLSPQLDWTDAPADALSFAVFFEDLSINFSHSAIFDIPADLTGLPADVDKQAMPADVPGATQPRSYANNFGYAGPCPGEAHTYQFTLYAIDVENIAEIDQNSSLGQVKTALEQHAIASATLSGEFTPP